MITVALRIGTKDITLGEKRESISLCLFAADTSLHTEQPQNAEFRWCQLISWTREQHCWGAGSSAAVRGQDLDAELMPEADHWIGEY